MDQGGVVAEEKHFIEAAADLDHPEVAQWFMVKEGASVPPFDTLVARFPFVVRNALQVLNWSHPGL
jgi:hypothetical protein